MSRQPTTPAGRPPRRRSGRSGPEVGTPRERSGRSGPEVGTPRERSGRSGPRYIEHDELYREVLLKGLEEARAKLWLATANLKQTLVERPGRPGRFRPLAEALAELAAGGVEVRLLHAGAPSQPFLKSLKSILLKTAHSNGALCQAGPLEAGLLKSVPGFEMRRCVRVHFKTIIVDEAAAYIGSANLTGAGLGAKAPERRNFEVGLWIEDMGIVRRIRDLFSAVWEGAFCAGCGRADNCPEPVAGPK